MATNITKAGNTLDTKIVEQFISDYERHDREIASIKAENAKRCRDVQDRQKKVLELVKGAGMTPKAFKAVIDIRKAEAKKASIQAALEDQDAESFEAIQASLGQLADTPLGQAATSGNVTKLKAKAERTVQ